MPIPKPTPNEEQSHYISRCISFLKNEKPDMDSKQAAAICFQTWRDTKKE